MVVRSPQGTLLPSDTQLGLWKWSFMIHLTRVCNFTLLHSFSQLEDKWADFSMRELLQTVNSEFLQMLRWLCSWLWVFKNQRPGETALWSQELQAGVGMGEGRQGQAFLYLPGVKWRRVLCRIRGFSKSRLTEDPGNSCLNPLLVWSCLSLLRGTAETRAYSFFFFTSWTFPVASPAPSF